MAGENVQEIDEIDEHTLTLLLSTFSSFIHRRRYSEVIKYVPTLLIYLSIEFQVMGDTTGW